MRFILFTFIALTFTLHAEEDKKKEPLKERAVETSHTLQMNGAAIPYKATAGTLVLKDDDGKDKGSVFYVAYTKEGVEDPHNRPITFCFNGGPGSSSVWLHLGALGPRRVDLEQSTFDSPPYGLHDNKDSILDITDLVFIDPVSTGYSRPAPGEDAKQFHGVEADIASVGKFIRLFTTRNGRWESPKFLAGESYGSTRAASLADHLQDKYGMYVNGVILISTVLNFNTINTSDYGNDLPYILFLPSYTLSAWYHKKLSPELQAMDPDELLHQVEAYASGPFAAALFQGDRLPQADREKVASQLAAYTGLTPLDIERNNLRMSVAYFAKNLLRDENKTIGRFDGRTVGYNIDNARSTRDYDPSYEAIYGAFTAAFYQYVSRELKWESDDEYKVLTNVFPWNFGDESIMSLNVSPNLREVMIKNPKLRVLVANGNYDLATPCFATDYTFDHLNLPAELRDHITLTYYNGGHMMYTDLSNLEELKKDLTEFINKKP